MSLSIGRTIIHPHHGPVVVTDRITRTLRGEPVEYAELRVTGDGMTISIPVKIAREIGLRDLANKTQMKRLAKTLSGPTTDKDGQWARRMKAYASKVNSGQPLQVAEVVRDLIRRREERGISLAEREILRDALEPMVAEMAIVREISQEAAEEMITDMVLTGVEEAAEVIPVA